MGFMRILPIEHFLPTSCHNDPHMAALVRPSFLGPLSSSSYCMSFKCSDHGSGITPAIKFSDIGSNDSSIILGLPHLQSGRGLQELQEYFRKHDSGGFSLSVWITPPHLPDEESTSHDVLSHNGSDDEPGNIIRPIITFGISQNVNAAVSLGCQDYNLMLFQNKDSLLLTYRHNYPLDSCQTIVIDGEFFRQQILSHVAITLNRRGLRVWRDGDAIFIPSNATVFSTSLQNWIKPANLASLQIFSNYQHNLQSDRSSRNGTGQPFFNGTIHELAIYDRSLNTEQARKIYQERVCNESCRRQQKKDAIIWNITLQDSVDGLYQIALVSGPETIPEVSQGTGTPTLLRFGGWRVNTVHPHLFVELLSLPQHGVLSEATNCISFPIAPILLQPDLTTFWLNYAADRSDYFNLPAVDAKGNPLKVDPEFFTYRYVVMNVRSEIIAVSQMIRQDIKVVHANHRPTFLGPQKAVYNEADDTFSISNLIFEDESDLDLYQVVVNIQSSHGQILLNKMYLDKADFSLCDSAALACPKNGGNRDRTASFVALPSHVTSILKDLQYKSLIPGIADEVLIRIFDGPNFGCLAVEEHKRRMLAVNETESVATTSDGCFEVQVLVRIPGKTIGTIDDDISSSYDGRFTIPTKLEDFETFDIIFSSTLLLLLCCFAVGFYRCWKRAARGATVELAEWSDRETTSIQPWVTSDACSNPNHTVKWQQQDV